MSIDAIKPRPRLLFPFPLPHMDPETRQETLTRCQPCRPACHTTSHYNTIISHDNIPAIARAARACEPKVRSAQPCPRTAPARSPPSSCSKLSKRMHAWPCASPPSATAVRLRQDRCTLLLCSCQHDQSIIVPSTALPHQCGAASQSSRQPPMTPLQRQFSAQYLDSWLAASTIARAYPLTLPRCPPTRSCCHPAENPALSQ